MACGCEKDKFPPQVMINVGGEAPVLFRLVRRPADFGDDETNPPAIGEFKNVLLNYVANNHTYIYSSDGIPVLLTGTAESTGTLNFDELMNRPKYGGAEMTSGTDIPDLTDTIASLTVEINGKQATLTDIQLTAVNSGIDSSKVAQIATNAVAIAANASDIDTIEEKIPAQATAENQLADKDFVNSSVATNTANFVGTFNSLEALEAVENPTNNDYGFVISTDTEGDTVYRRYKYSSEDNSWLFEYDLNNSSFTAEQWAAIQSGVTAGLVEKLQGIPADAEANDINSISVNGTAVAPDENKNVDLTIPENSVEYVNLTVTGWLEGNSTYNTTSDKTLAEIQALMAANKKVFFKVNTSISEGSMSPGVYEIPIAYSGSGGIIGAAGGFTPSGAAVFVYTLVGPSSQVNGSIRILECAASDDIPTRVSELANDSNFVTATQVATAVESALEEAEEDLVAKADIKNNLTTATAGFVLDASQGKALNDLITALTTRTSQLETQIADMPIITMTDTDPGEGIELDANHFLAVYEAE